MPSLFALNGEGIVIQYSRLSRYVNENSINKKTMRTVRVLSYNILAYPDIDIVSIVGGIALDNVRRCYRGE